MEKQKDCRVKPSDNSALLFCRKDCTAENLRHESHMIYRPDTRRRSEISNRSANMPFRFVSCMELREVLGKRAMDEHRWLELIEEVPADSIYYHTHSYFLMHAYTQQLYSNDFATWVVLYATPHFFRCPGSRKGCPFHDFWSTPLSIPLVKRIVSWSLTRSTGFFNEWVCLVINRSCCKYHGSIGSRTRSRRGGCVPPGQKKP